jgi:hypothetical protein
MHPRTQIIYRAPAILNRGLALSLPPAITSTVIGSIFRSRANNARAVTTSARTWQSRCSAV